MQPQWEVADVLRHTDLQSFTVHQQKTLRALKDCRTADLGGHVDACDGCGNISISYNSCRNRHCPKCQGHKREECLPDWSFRRGYKSGRQTFCPALIFILCSHYHSSSMALHCNNLPWFTMYCLKPHGKRSMLLQAKRVCNWA